MRVEQSRMVNSPNAKVLNSVIDGWLEESDRNNDPIFFSDLLVNWEDTYPLVKALMADDTPKYKIFVICDEWGQKVKPGDKVRRVTKKPLIVDGIPVTSSEMNSWKAQGIYEQKRFKYKYYDVDEKGCITVPAGDAEYFLRVWGIHSVSGMKISSHAIEKSVDKAKDPTDEKMKHVHYWRYKEMTREMYEVLPYLTEETVENPEHNQNNKGYKHK